MCTINIPISIKNNESTLEKKKTHLYRIYANVSLRFREKERERKTEKKEESDSPAYSTNANASLSTRYLADCKRIVLDSNIYVTLAQRTFMNITLRLCIDIITRQTKRRVVLLFYCRHETMRTVRRAQNDRNSQLNLNA